MTVVSYMKAGLLASVACTAVLATATGASAGGFALREQSAEFQGMSFAGNAAGGSLSSMFWNSAATASRDGMNFESSISAIMARTEVTVDKATVSNSLGSVACAQRFGNIAGCAPGGAQFNAVKGLLQGGYDAASATADGISPWAAVAASYGNYQIGNVYVGMGVNSPFGLALEPNNSNYKAGTLAQTGKMVAFNFNPTVAMKIMPGVTIGVGAQIQSAEATFRFLSTTPTGGFVSYEANGWGFGGTAGIIIEPMTGTTLGVGYRSRIDQELEGLFDREGTGQKINGKATINLPDIVTISLKQVVSPVMRLAGTFEWSNWSRFKTLDITATESGKGVLNVNPIGAGGLIASLPEHWGNGWMVAFGGEYDLSPALTVRAGYAYEHSPVDDPTKRSPGFPDNNRHWMSFGGSWKALTNTTIDLAWSHIFVQEGQFNRDTLAPDLAPTASTNIQGHTNASIDIISVGLKTHF